MLQSFSTPVGGWLERLVRSVDPSSVVGDLGMGGNGGGVCEGYVNLTKKSANVRIIAPEKRAGSP